jgi:RimJ/RimL family protein N-acetyltransferase
VLETERLVLRPFARHDLDETAAMFADAETMRYYPRPFTREESLGWIDWNLRLYAKRGFGLWVIELKETGEFAGDCGLIPQQIEGTEEIEIGYHVVRQLWRRGVASEAAAACRDYARDALGLERVVSIIDPENVPSQGVARKVGMELEREIVKWERRQLLFSMDLKK